MNPRRWMAEKIKLKYGRDSDADGIAQSSWKSSQMTLNASNSINNWFWCLHSNNKRFSFGDPFSTAQVLEISLSWIGRHVASISAITAARNIRRQIIPKFVLLCAGGYSDSMSLFRLCDWLCARDDVTVPSVAHNNNRERHSIQQ